MHIFFDKQSIVECTSDTDHFRRRVLVLNVFDSVCTLEDRNRAGID
jgi:hypothetical protein